ncbi:dihydroneopterin aldolase [Ideonella sp. YS5]|uniref:dihydroneopterin aldolase n=1 Tax=Ideonella sp. YS5 TaxID=3453714 RepID=UPI003EEEDF29
MQASAKAPLSTLNSQILQLSGLRFGANLGVLAHERTAPQPIQVDAELNLGEQPALARDAHIGHVLDYRKVRQIIIDECTAEHTDLLESLLAKLCVRLMRLPGVLGVRIRVAKLEIFDDCEVAIRCDAGVW